MSNKQRPFFLFAAILLATAALIGFQNCADSLGPSESDASGSSVDPTPPPAGPTMSMIPFTMSLGATANVTANFANIDSNYTIQWTVTPADGGFASTSGTFPVGVGTTQATFNVVSTATAGTGNKSYTLALSESTGHLKTIQVVMNVNETIAPSSLTTASSTTCAVFNGIAKCWGANPNGDIGDNTVVGKTSPTALNNSPTGKVSQISHGLDTTCAVFAGALYCWGQNTNGQLGDGTLGDNHQPGLVTGMDANVTSVSVGGGHVCAIKNSGLYCWGLNSSGQLGLGTTVNHSAAPSQPISSLSSNVTAVSAGQSSTCAIQNGIVYCFGANGVGQIGDGTTGTNRLSPVAVSGITTGATDVSVGSQHACAVVSKTVRCWGLNTSGQLGDNTVVNKSVSTAISGITNASQVVSGAAHTCALIGGAVQCWGANANGQLGDGTTVAKHVPAAITSLSSGIERIAAGEQGNVSCAVKASKFSCWGINTNGQLGDGTTAQKLAPNAFAGW